MTDADGVVYRYFPGRGFEFHPLGNFAALNAAAGEQEPRRRRRGWRAHSSRAPSPRRTARSGSTTSTTPAAAPRGSPGSRRRSPPRRSPARPTIDTDRRAALREAARGAYRSLPGRLVEPTRFGSWIRLYGFNHDVVLNAQLQSAISLADYARTTGGRRGRRARRGPQGRSGPRAAELQHRLLVVLRPPSRRLGRPLPGLRRAASRDPRSP